MKNIKRISEKLSFSFKNFPIPDIVYVLVLGFIIRILLSFFGTLQLDHGTFVAWSMSLAKDGLASFYNNWSDYLPGYPYVLWVLGKVHAFNVIPETLLYKLPAIISDCITAYLIYKIVKGKKGVLGALIYLFNPAVFSNSALWGQVDSLVALFSLLCLYFLPRNIILSSTFLAVGTLVKPQVAFLIPLIILLMFKNKMQLRKIIAYVLVGATISVLIFVPFKNEPNLFNFIFNRLKLSANQYPYTAVNAFNFWGLFGQWKADNLYFQFGGYLSFLISFLLLSRKLWRTEEKTVGFVYKLAAFTFAFSFLFFTRMHERHLLPLFAPLTIIAVQDFIFLIPLAGFSLVYVLNLFYSFKWIAQDYLVSFDPFPVIILGLFSFGLMIYSMISPEKIRNTVRALIFFFNKKRRLVKDDLPAISISKKRARITLAAILLFSLVTRVYRIGLPSSDYFDEIYHAFTARLVLHGDPKAWEWWNPNPEGFAYEWTHPPLSKLVMVVGMKIFGENSFGWRIPQAIFGTLSVYVLYLLAKKIFKDETLSLLAAFIFSLDGLFLVLSRMGMNDVYVLFFMLLSVLFFYSGKDFLSSISLGLAIASKWSGIWTIPILFVVWLKRKQKFKPPIFWFLIVPIGVYLLAYLPMFFTGHDLGTWWGMQQQMWWYHTGLKATHPYTSMWWSWPLDLRPVYLYTSDEINGVVSRIYAIGNPMVFWFGLASVLTSGLYAFYEKNKKLGLVVFSYLIFFTPWAASPRIMFLYHYLPSIPFMCIATAYILRRNPKLIKFYLLTTFLVFIYFYPHWAGLPVPLQLDKSYYWLTSWR